MEELWVSLFCISWSKTGPSSMMHLVEHEGFPFFLSLLQRHNLKTHGYDCVCAQFCLTLCNRMDCSLLGSSVHGVLLARILECVAVSFSRGSSQTRDWTCVSCTGRWTLYHCTTWEAQGSWLHRYYGGCNRYSVCCVWFFAYLFLMLKYYKNFWRSKKCLNRKERLRCWLQCDHKYMRLYTISLNLRLALFQSSPRTLFYLFLFCLIFIVFCFPQAHRSMIWITKRLDIQ